MHYDLNYIDPEYQKIGSFMPLLSENSPPTLKNHEPEVGGLRPAKYINLDPYRIPLTGNSLIEASAGTGKTYNITLLYIRLILGLDAIQDALPIRNILVVTFTKAATAELRDRIRKRLIEMHALLNESDQITERDAALVKMLELIDYYQMDRVLCRDLLSNAIAQIEQASIFTIHSFCQRVLGQNAFLAKMPFDVELSTDLSELLEQAAINFWRQECYFFEEPLARLVHHYYRSPEYMIKLLGGYLQKPYLKHRIEEADNEITIDSTAEKLMGAIESCKTLWKMHRTEFADTISQPELNQTKYKASAVPNYLEQMDDWADSTHLGFPECVEKFTEKYFKTGITKKNPLPDPPPVFSQFEALVDRITVDQTAIELRLKYFAVRKIDSYLIQLKEQNQVMGFDDLLYFCYHALDSDQGEFAATLRAQFPVALIDEFQDTDALQYEIFSRIYPPEISELEREHENSKIGLIMIGDPKQAIYRFRGADIHAYLEAKAKTPHIYTLNENYRASRMVCEGINILFEQVTHPFIESQIPFLPISVPDHAQFMHLLVDQIPQKGLIFHHADTQGSVTKKDSDQYLAEIAACQIYHVLEGSRQQRIQLQNQIQTRSINQNDITILVKHGGHARLMKLALQGYGIETVYFSEKSTIFQQKIAHSFYLILNAIHNPKAIDILKQALATPLFGLTTPQLLSILHDEGALEQQIFQFIEFATLWKNQGVLALTHHLLTAKHAYGSIKSRLLAQENGQRDLTDILHLAELLQVEGRALPTTEALLSWFYTHIENPPDAFEESQQLRLERETNTVRIYTYHKAKGLEFPIVFIPFALHVYTPQTRYDVYDAVLKKRVLDFNQDKEQAADDWLKEELRLLYVAMTRAVYQCHLGIYDIKPSKKDEPLKAAALHHLLGCHTELTLTNACERLIATHSDVISLMCHSIDSALQSNDLNDPVSHEVPLERVAKVFKRKVDQSWQFTSYSHLTRQHYPEKKPVPQTNVLAFEQMEQFEFETNQNDVPDYLMNPEDVLISTPQMALDPIISARFDFPKGPKAGVFLHQILEKIQLETLADKQPNNILENQLIQSQLLDAPELWRESVQVWLHDILITPLDPHNSLCLSALELSKKLIELEFIFPINHPIRANVLATLIERYYPHPDHATTFHFESVQGMLKGFVDLVCEWQGKFYVIDYKSNYLGDTFKNYEVNALYTDVKAHQYELQFLIYTIALHRYLTQMMPEYDYECDFGGVYYLYLRGMNGKNNDTGVYFTKPDVTLIKALDAFFG